MRNTTLKLLVERYAPETVQAQLRTIETAREVEREARNEANSLERELLATLPKQAVKREPEPVYCTA